MFSYNCLYFCVVGCYFSSLICDFIYLDTFFFPFDKSGYRFINFIIFFKEQAPGFIDMFYCLFICFYIVYFCSSVYYLLPSAGLRLYFLLFLASLGVRLDHLFENLLLHEVDLHCYILPLKTAFSASQKFWTVVFSFSFVTMCFFFNFFFDFQVDTFII